MSLPREVAVRTPPPFPERTISVASHNIRYPDASEMCGIQNLILPGCKFKIYSGSLPTILQ